MIIAGPTGVKISMLFTMTAGAFGSAFAVLWSLRGHGDVRDRRMTGVLMACLMRFSAAQQLYWSTNSTSSSRRLCGAMAV